MDATVAGLVGALGGAVLGAAGAWGAALIAFRAARYQADRQADAQQEQWLRQIRRETYGSFFEAADRCTEHLNKTQSLRGASDEEQSEHRALFREGRRNFHKALVALNLEAPEEIRQKAAELADEFSIFAEMAMALPSMPGEWDASIGRLRKVAVLKNELHQRCWESLNHSK
ncbi:hypothetical protein ACFY8Z_36480 [Streptomyces microflavus]|uniref:hypothetical protein n=1 Tax=Streptomyces microflavus TaxID=1919 RepID=UPI0036E89A82